MNAQRQSAAFTLLEMLLVLAILAAVAAITYPALDRVYKASRLRETANELRARLATTRLKAIEDGISYQLRIEPNGRHLLVIPNDASELRFGEGTDEPSIGSDNGWFLHVMLPEGLSFEVESDETERIDADLLRRYEIGRDLFRVSWSTPIVFSPRGTATPATVGIVDAEGRSLVLRIRGLTGAATVSRGDDES